MTVTGQAILAEARKHIGQHEDPPGSNTGPFVIACQRASFLAGTGWPWCAAFEDYVCAQAGVPLAYNGAGAHDQADHHKPWVDAAHAQPGMIVDYNIGTGHTGIVAAIDLHAGMVTSVDGNWSDSVVEHTLPLSMVRAFWRIPGVTYTRKPTPPQPAPRLPLWVVTTSANGHTKLLFRTRHKKTLVDWLMHHTISKIAPNGITIRRPKK